MTDMVEQAYLCGKNPNPGPGFPLPAGALPTATANAPGAMLPTSSLVGVAHVAADPASVLDWLVARVFVAQSRQFTSARAFVMGGTGAAGAIATGNQLVLVTDTASALASANLSFARHGAASMSCNGVKGFVLGGGWWNGSATVTVVTGDKLPFATATIAATASSNLTTARQSGAGFSDGAVNGFSLGGNTGSSNATRSAVAEMIPFATETTAAQASANLTAARGGPASMSDAVSTGLTFSGNAASGLVTTCDGTPFVSKTTAVVSAAAVNVAREQLAPVALGPQYGFIFGGVVSDGTTSIEQVAFGAAPVTSALASPVLSALRYGSSAVGDGGSKSFVCGGYNTGSTYLATTDKFTLATRTCAAQASANLAAAARLPAGMSDQNV
jgi:hypothetical protein